MKHIIPYIACTFFAMALAGCAKYDPNIGKTLYDDISSQENSAPRAYIKSGVHPYSLKQISSKLKVADGTYTNLSEPVSIPLSMTSPAKEKMTFKIKVDENQARELKASNPDVKILSENQFSFQTDEVSVEAGQKTGAKAFKVKIEPKGLDEGKYLLPLMLTDSEGNTSSVYTKFSKMSISLNMGIDYEGLVEGFSLELPKDAVSVDIIPTDYYGSPAPTLSDNILTTGINGVYAGSYRLSNLNKDFRIIGFTPMYKDSGELQSSDGFFGKFGKVKVTITLTNDKELEFGNFEIPFKDWASTSLEKPKTLYLILKKSVSINTIFFQEDNTFWEQYSISEIKAYK